MTATELCDASRPLNPRIQLRDVWILMRQFEERKLTRCLNRRQKTGKLYCLTDHGRQVVREAFGVAIKPVARGVNWNKYSQVARAKIRKLVLLAIAKWTAQKGAPVSASEIRRSNRIECPVGLNPVIRAIKDLRSLGLIAAGPQSKDRRTSYSVTQGGKRIVAQLTA